MRKVFLITIVFISSAVFGRHPVHFSFINMEFDKDSMTIEYSIKLFQDDYLNLLEFIYHDALHNAKTNDIVLDTTLVEKYFQNSVIIKADDTILAAEFKHKVYSETEANLYFKVKLNFIPDILSIENKILLELFTDQANLVIFSCGNSEKGLTFNGQTTKQLFALKDIL